MDCILTEQPACIEIMMGMALYVVKGDKAVHYDSTKEQEGHNAG